MKKVIDRIIKELENVSYFTESTYDEDGYSNDDGEEVVNLCKAVDIVKKVLEEYYIARQDRVNGKIIGNQQCLDKLGQLEDAEEKGLLLRLPCKVGDKVYRPVPELYRTYTKSVITDICITEDGIFFSTDKRIDWKIETIGKTIFLTKEEAEQALKEMEKK